MNNSYRVQAERRASLCRTPASRNNARPPLELPPWGYGSHGSGRQVLSMPTTTINTIGRHPKRTRTRSVSPTKQQSNGHCETGPTQAACSRPNAVNTGPSNYANLTTHHRKPTEHGSDACAADPVAVVDVDTHHHHRVTSNHRSTTAGDSVAEKCVAVSHEHKRLDDDTKNVGSAADCPVPTEHPCTLEEGVDSMGDMPVVGGGPVTSSSMETWTTYDTTSPRGGLQSAVSSPHSVLTPAGSSQHSVLLAPPTPALDSSPPQSATSWLRRISSTVLSPNGPPLDANSAKNTTESTNSALPSPPAAAPDVADSQTVTILSTLTTDSEPLTQEVPMSPRASSERSPKQKTITSPVTNDDPASCEVTTDRPDSSKSDNNSQEIPQPEVSPKTGQPKSPESTDETKSNLMVGLVKVKSRHTGLMIDCPILETVYQNDTASSPTAVRQSSSHKVVLIKAVVPRWAWNGHGQFSPNSSSRASVSSARNTDREMKASKRKSSVSVNTQTSETLLLNVRRTISEHQVGLSPISAKPPVDTLKYVPARRDDWRLSPSPKHSRCRSFERSPTPVESRVVVSPNDASHRTLPEESNSTTAPSYFDSTQEEPKESGFQKRSSFSMEYDVLMADTLETLKLDLQLSSSGNNSDSDSIQRGNTAVKSSTAERITRGSSSSSGPDTGQRRPSCPTLNWSSAATTAAKASSDAINNFKTFNYVDRRALAMMQSPPQKTATVVSGHSLPAHGRSPASYKDGYCKSRAKSKNTQSANSSQTNEINSRHISNTSPRLVRPPCLWRPLSHNNVMDSWQELDFTGGQDPHYYKHKQRHQTASSRSESSLSDRSKSRHYNFAPIKVSSLISSNSWKSRHSDQNSIAQLGYLAASGGGTDPVEDVDTHHHHSNYRSTTSGDVVSTPRRSQHNHHKHRTAEGKLATQERRATSTSTVNRAYEKRHRLNAEAARCGGVTPNARSNGSSAVSRNASIPKPSSKRHHSSSVSRHMSAGTPRTEKRNVPSDQSAMSRGQHYSSGDSKRRSRTQHSHQPDRPSTPSSGGRQRHGNRVIKTSVSRSIESLSRRRVRQPPVHANYSTTISEQSKSTQPKRQSRCHDDRKSEEKFYECRQAIVYRSPRSLKPFPPPISDRYQGSPFDKSSTAAVGTPSDAESFKNSFVQDESDFAETSKNYRPLNNPQHRQERPRHHRRSTQTSVDDQRHVKPNSGGTRRHHKKLPVAPPCTDPRSAMPSLMERPAWKRY